MTLKAFRYSGNKTKLLSLYKEPPKETKRIIECYLGSGAYTLNSSLPTICYETNKSLCEMWWWLQRTTAKELHELDKFIRDEKKKAASIGKKANVKNMKLEIGPETYVRVNVCSVVVGQLSSWSIYPQNHLPISNTIECLSRIRDMEIRNESCNAYQHQENDLLFVDPPYIGTVGNYMGSKREDHEKSYQPNDTVDLVNSTSNSIIFTYGSNAEEIFPMYEWITVKKICVPNMRKGGTVDRYEKVSYIHWKEEEPINLFS